MSAAKRSADNQHGARAVMKRMRLRKAFTLIESGPVVLVTTTDGRQNNLMTSSWTMVLDFAP